MASDTNLPSNHHQLSVTRLTEDRKANPRWRAVLFDLDGTLVDTAPDILGTLNVLLLEDGMRAMDHAALRPFVGTGIKGLMQESYKRQERAWDSALLAPFTERFLAHYNANIARHSAPYPHVIALLDLLKNKGIKSAIVTNKTHALADHLIGQLGLSHYFDAIVGPDTFGVSKPEPDPLLRTLELIGEGKEHAIMIGDGPADVLAAQAADIPVIGVNQGYTTTPLHTLKPDYLFDDLQPVYDYFARF